MSQYAQTFPSKWRLIHAALLAALLAMPGTAGAGGFDQFVGFGDSSMDSGYFRYHSTGGSPGAGGPGSAAAIDAAIAATVAAGGTGAFAGPGVLDTIQLAAKFGLTALPSTIPGGLGTNFANGSAQTVPTTADNGYLNGLYNNVPIVTQMTNYLASAHNRADPNALYMISFGGNDLTWLEVQGGTLSPATYLQSLSNSMTSAVASLQAAGARTIVVLNVYAYARLVGPGGTFTATNAVDLANATMYSADVWAGLGAARVNFVPADIEGVLRYASQNPARFGFTAASVLATNPACGVPSALLCAPRDLVAPDAEQTHLWSDDHHLSTAGQALEADLIYSLLAAPNQISLLAETAVRDGLARALTIRGQIDLSARSRGPNGINVWISAGAGNLSTKNAPNLPKDEGTPFGGTIGADYLMPNGVLLGAAVSVGDAVQGYSSGGQFEQVDDALSLYAAYRTGPLWGDAVASYGLLRDHVARQVPLGIFTDHNSGDSSGHDLALALRGGWDFHTGAVTFGPVAGFVLQQARFDGFTESGSTGFTALSFGGQTRNSAVSQLGVRAAVDIGAWQPFAELGWSHEWADRHRTITASLTSIAAPSWTAPAVPIAVDWATATAGVSYRVTERTSVRGAFSAMFFSPEVGSYGGGVWLSVGF